MEPYDTDNGQILLEHMIEELETALKSSEDDSGEIAVGLSGLYNGIQNAEWNDSFNDLDDRFLHLATTSAEKRHHVSEHLLLDNQQDHSPSANNVAEGIDPEISSQNCEHLPNVSPFETNSGLHASGGSALEQLLISCAEAIDKNDQNSADVLMVHLKQEVSIYGTPIQRLGAYMAEGLIARKSSTGLGIYKAKKCSIPPAAKILSAWQKMHEICPYFKFGFIAANGAIAESFKDESKVHIIDFQITVGPQWTSLIQALANRHGGPPSLRITGVGDPDGESATNGDLETVGQRLRDLAKEVGVLFEFHPLSIRTEELQASMFNLRQGEALAVNFTYHLHHMADESVSVTNLRDRLLRLVRSMNPKVLTLVEKEANTNKVSFLPRFLETLNYFSAVFEAIDIALPRDSKDRVDVEQNCLARDIVNIIACEGAERVERFEPMGKWRGRLMMAGFKPHPLSYYVNSTIKTLLELYSGNYWLKEEGDSLSLGWLDRPLVVASAWH